MKTPSLLLLLALLLVPTAAAVNFLRGLQTTNPCMDQCHTAEVNCVQACGSGNTDDQALTDDYTINCRTQCGIARDSCVSHCW